MSYPESLDLRIGAIMNWDPNPWLRAYMENPEGKQFLPPPKPGLREWTQRLLAVSRYEGIEMVHRPNLLVHSMAVKALAVRMGLMLDRLEDEQIFFDFLPGDIIVFANHHDIAEILTPDIPAPIKRALSKEQRLALHEEENRACRTLCQELFGCTGEEEINHYLALQKTIREKETTAAQIVNFADKFDCLGEKLHEIVCGNTPFIPLVENSRLAFEDLSRYDFYPYLKDVFGLAEIPDEEDLRRLPQLTREDLRQDLPLFENPAVKAALTSWPTCYVKWLEFRLDSFWGIPYDQEIFYKAVFPGWFPGLTEKLGFSSQQVPPGGVEPSIFRSGT